MLRGLFLKGTITDALFLNLNFTAVPLALQQIYKFLHVSIFQHIDEGYVK